MNALFIQASAEGVLDQERPLDKTGVKCVDQQMECLMVLKKVFDEAQNCAPCAQCDTTLKGKLAAVEDQSRKMQITVDDLTEGKCADILWDIEAT